MQLTSFGSHKHCLELRAYFYAADSTRKTVREQLISTSIDEESDLVGASCHKYVVLWIVLDDIERTVFLDRR